MTVTDTDTSAELLARLRKAYATGRTRDAEWRIRQLRGIEKLADEREAEIAAALQEDLGRNAVEAWLADLASTRAEAAYARKRVRRWMLPRPKPLSLNQFPALGWVQYEPMGVVLIIAPWNYPVYLTLGPLVAAVAAGNCAVIKPSELAPATSALLARLIPHYLDPEAVVVAEGDAELTQSLLAQGFDLALYTGGTEVGRKIMAAAAPQLTPVILELGGKSPVVVAEDADLEVTARRIAWVKLLNSGRLHRARLRTGRAVRPRRARRHDRRHDRPVPQRGTAAGDAGGQPASLRSARGVSGVHDRAHRHRRQVRS